MFSSVQSQAEAVFKMSSQCIPRGKDDVEKSMERRGGGRPDAVEKAQEMVG